MTFATQLSFIILLDHSKIPDWFRRSLDYMPVAVLSAIILPELATHNAALDVSLRNPQFYTGALPILVTWIIKNVLLSILPG